MLTLLFSLAACAPASDTDTAAFAAEKSATCRATPIYVDGTYVGCTVYQNGVGTSYPAGCMPLSACLSYCSGGSGSGSGSGMCGISEHFEYVPD